MTAVVKENKNHMLWFYNFLVTNSFNESVTHFLADIASKNGKTLSSQKPHTSYVGFTEFHIKFSYLIS